MVILLFSLVSFEDIVFGMYNGPELGWVGEYKRCCELKIWKDAKFWKDGLWVSGLVK